MSLQDQLEQLKALKPSELRRAAAKCSMRNLPLNGNTVRFDEGPFAGHEWRYSMGRDYSGKTALTLPFTIRGETGFYEYRHIKPFAPAVVWVTIKENQS